MRIRRLEVKHVRMSEFELCVGDLRAEEFSNAQVISPVPAAQSSNRPADPPANSHASLSRI